MLEACGAWVAALTKKESFSCKGLRNSKYWGYCSDLRANIPDRYALCGACFSCSGVHGCMGSDVIIEAICKGNLYCSVLYYLIATN